MLLIFKATIITHRVLILDSIITNIKRTCFLYCTAAGLLTFGSTLKLCLHYFLCNCLLSCDNDLVSGKTNFGN